MTVDAHQHFWDPPRRTYPWMTKELDAIRRPFGPQDLAAVARPVGVERTVLVQTVSSVLETQEFLALAANQELIAGVVGWVDLMDPDVAGTISRLRKEEGGAKLVGIRHQVHDEADPEWLLRDDVQRGLDAVEEAGLTYDLLVRARELPAAYVSARKHPQVRFVIDHAAKPRIASGPRDHEWEEAMAPMAELPNVTCKISGLVTEADWSRWDRAGLEPYVRRVLEWFGPKRCMFGSDWPVCLLASSYERVFGTIREIVGEDDDVFSRTAIRVYRLSA
jgi:L-fucono-1,5-lactonase